MGRGEDCEDMFWYVFGIPGFCLSLFGFVFFWRVLPDVVVGSST